VVKLNINQLQINHPQKKKLKARREPTNFDLFIDELIAERQAPIVAEEQ